MNKLNIVFIDLDGTLITTKSGFTFPVDYKDWKLIPKVNNHVKELLKSGDYDKVVLITNQAGISSGKVSRTELDKKIKEIGKQLHFNLDKIIIADSYSSPFRKPRIAGTRNYLRTEGIEIGKGSIMIGDAGGREHDFSNSDAEFAKLLGIKFTHVDDIN